MSTIINPILSELFLNSKKEFSRNSLKKSKTLPETLGSHHDIIVIPDIRASPIMRKKKASKAIFLASKSYFLRFG